jgi:hypothetical protein
LGVLDAPSEITLSIGSTHDARTRVVAATLAGSKPRTISIALAPPIFALGLDVFGQGRPLRQNLL